MNIQTFETSFSSIIANRVDVTKIKTKKEAWDVYFKAMLETPTLLMSMPEEEVVFMTVKNAFPKVDWVN